jgi:hypothetical protein
MNDEEIVDGEFEEITEREVISEADLSDKDRENIASSEAAEVSPEDAAAFARELEAAQKDLDVVVEPSDQRPLTQAEMMAAIKNAAQEGMLSNARKHRIMQEMGIYNSTFTKKRNESKATKAKKRKQQKNARRKNRK